LEFVVGGDVPTAKELLLLSKAKTVDNSEIWRGLRLKVGGKLWITLGITCGLVTSVLWISLQSASSVVEFGSNSEELMTESVLSSRLSQVITSEGEMLNNENDMFKIERLMYAMAEHEGWMSSLRNLKGVASVAFRNNNPGNLRDSPFKIGIKDGFAVFNSENDGFSAFKWDILQKCKGKTVTGLNGESSLADFLRKWAPSADNNDENLYIERVTNMTGFSANIKLKDLCSEYLP